VSPAASRTKKYTWFLTLAFVVCLTACDRENRSSPGVRVLSPTSSVRTAIVPQTLILNPVAGGRCPFTTAFDLVIDHQGRNALFIEQVTIRLFDGSSVGGSPVLMSAADLTARFGSMQVRPGATRRFGLQPRFGCETFLPRSLGTEILVRDASGMQQTVGLIVPIG
jgi:hypothetical protein